MDDMPVLERERVDGGSSTRATETPSIASNENMSQASSREQHHAPKDVPNQVNGSQSVAQVIRNGILMRPESEREAYAFKFAKDLMSMNSHRMTDSLPKNITKDCGTITILTEEQARALKERRGQPPRVGIPAAGPAPAQAPEQTPPPLRPPRNVAESLQTTQRVQEMLQDARRQQEEQVAQEAQNPPPGPAGNTRRARRGGAGGGVQEAIPPAEIEAFPRNEIDVLQTSALPPPALRIPSPIQREVEEEDEMDVDIPAEEPGNHSQVDMDTSTEERATRSITKIKKKRNELAGLLNMDVGPKEGGVAAQVISDGTRRRSTTTPVQGVPARKVLPKRNAQIKRAQEDGYDDDEDEEQEDGKGTSDGPSTSKNAKRRRGAAAPEADRTKPGRPRKETSRSSEQPSPAAPAKKKPIVGALPPANNDAPPALTPIGGSSSSPATSQVRPESRRVASLFLVGPPQQSSAQSTPSSTAPAHAESSIGVGRIARVDNNAERIPEREQQQARQNRTIKEELNQQHLQYIQEMHQQNVKHQQMQQLRALPNAQMPRRPRPPIAPNIQAVLQQQQPMQPFQPHLPPQFRSGTSPQASYHMQPQHQLQNPIRRSSGQNAVAQHQMGPGQQLQQFIPARGPIEAPVVITPPQPMQTPPQAPLPVRPPHMTMPIRPVLGPLYDESDYIDEIPLPNGNMNFLMWNATEYADWMKQVMANKKGEEMVALILEEEHEGIYVEEFMKNPDDMKNLYGLTAPQLTKIKHFAAATINKQKRAAYEKKMGDYEEQMRIYNLPH